ncbi:P2Y purinoceptor 14-like [Dunckerocampus dactyliophorus]|uniref:P2Y purinoceptor 14-like n=1 Tax=Dunckerocampus dactyliophorus TaxID=161453 RepID=UPI002405F237|nr:P2Y purinoceptor 14-like [Dunckerocampus dactyliophorus]
MSQINMSVLFGTTAASNQSSPDNQAFDGMPLCSQSTRSRVLFVVVYSLVFLVGLLLNGVTLRVYLCGTGTSSSIGIYLKNLAAADFLLCLCLPIRIAYNTTDSAGVRLVFCNFGAATFYLNMYASILFMGYIAANRYFRIVHSSGRHLLQSVRTARVASLVTWLVLLTITSSYIILSLVTQQAPSPSDGTASCSDLHSEQLSLLYKVVHAVSATIFLLVFLALLFFYYSASRRLAAAQQRRASSCGARRLAKARRKILVLVSVFCVCFLPYHLVRLPYALIPRHYWCNVHYWKDVTVTLSAFNVCLDPLIYFLFCKAFRAQLRQKQHATDVDTCKKTSTCPSSTYKS